MDKADRLSGRDLRPVIMPAEVVIFAGSEPANGLPHFPTEGEAWEYIKEIEGIREVGEIDDI